MLDMILSENGFVVDSYETTNERTNEGRRRFIDKMKLKDITLVVHDWGSGLGFHYAMRNEDKVTGIAFMEAILAPTERWDMFQPGFGPEGRKLFQAFRTPDVGWDMS